MYIKNTMNALQPKQTTLNLIASTARIKAVREDLALMCELDPFIPIEGCEDCNELEAYRGARFCRECSENRQELRERGLSVYRVSR